MISTVRTKEITKRFSEYNSTKYPYNKSVIGFCNGIGIKLTGYKKISMFLKSFYTIKTKTIGVVKIIYKNDIVHSINKIENCRVITTHYYIGIPVYFSVESMSDNDIINR